MVTKRDIKLIVLVNDLEMSWRENEADEVITSLRSGSNDEAGR